jgi:putative SOS response-associated peptidase YedK
VKWEEDPRDLEKLEKKGKAPKPVTWPVDLGGVKYKEGDVLESCTIITTDANPLMAKIHDRMPVILDPKNYDAWLDPDLNDAGILKALMKPFPAAKFAYWWVTAPPLKPIQTLYRI